MTTIMTNDRDYYCSVKFKYLKVDLESKISYNCHAAEPHAIDFQWLQKNKGQLFNSVINVFERNEMLQNIRNKSCNQNCWKAEDLGQLSPRQIQQGQEKTHYDVITNPEIIDLTIGTDCNLTCSYCSKENSSAWRNDLSKNGFYHIKEEEKRYSNNKLDLVLSNISQVNRYNSKPSLMIRDEISALSNNLKELVITGGEPLLHKFLIEIIDSYKHVPKIKLFTGLGINFDKFSKLMSKIKVYDNLYIAISVESTKENYEFNRYGMRWNDLIKKIDFLKENNFNIVFHSTLSNLTLLDFDSFYNLFSKNHQIEYDLVYNPYFMAPNVLDDSSKHEIISKLKKISLDNKDMIISSIAQESTDNQKNNLKYFLEEFVKRRNDLSLSIFPKSFLQWLNINVV